MAKCSHVCAVWGLLLYIWRAMCATLSTILSDSCLYCFSTYIAARTLSHTDICRMTFSTSLRRVAAHVILSPFPIRPSSPYKCRADGPTHTRAEGQTFTCAENTAALISIRTPSAVRRCTLPRPTCHSDTQHSKSIYNYAYTDFWQSCSCHTHTCASALHLGRTKTHSHCRRHHRGVVDFARARARALHDFPLCTRT